jgi:hypothetical protein
MDKKIEVKGTPYAPVALDPDHFLDDLVNRFEGCEPALGDDAMRRTVGFFSAPHLVLCVLLSFPPIEAFSRRGRCRTREAAQATEYQDQRISRGQAEGRASS